QVADNAVVQSLVSRLPSQVAAEEQARADAPGFQMAHQLIAVEWYVRSHRQRKAEPTWLGIGRCSGQDEIRRQVEEAIAQSAEIAAPGFDELRQFRKLGQADRGLHVGRLEVVADVRINVFVIVALR